MRAMNDILEDIVLTNNGIVTQPKTRNGLLGDWLEAITPTIITRIFITADPILQTHYTLQTDKSFAGSFRVSAEFSVSSPANETLLVIGKFFIRIKDDITIEVFADTSFSAAVFTVTSLGTTLHTLVVDADATSTSITLTLDGAPQTTTAGAQPDFTGSTIIAKRGSAFFSGVIANVTLTDLTTPSNSESWKLDQPFPITTEQSSSGGNLLTYVNADSVTRELFTLIDGDWFGAELVVNGSFDSADLSYFSTLNGSSIIISENELVTSNLVLNGGFAMSTTGMIAEFRYKIILTSATISGAAGVTVFANNASLISNILDVGQVEGLFTWNGVNQILVRYGGGGQTTLDQFSTDDVSVKRILEVA